jgi:hypothetical protein
MKNKKMCRKMSVVIAQYIMEPIATENCVVIVEISYK